jgi:hypothetical protein
MIDWVTDANIAQVVVAVASVAGLFFVGAQVHGARKTSDLQALYDFAARAEAIEARLNEAPDARVHRRVVYEFLNFLETTAAAYRRRLFGRASREIAHDKLVDSLATIWAMPEMIPIIEAGVTSGTTFLEIRKFITENKKAIVGLVAAKARQTGDTSDSL